MIMVGVHVETCFGSGTVVGKESFYGGKLVRWVVSLDDRTRWACSEITESNPVFHEKELQIIGDTEFAQHNLPVCAANAAEGER
jgi:hypothetical protein